MRLTIRPATSADLPAILDLLEPQELMKPLTRRQIAEMWLYRWRDPADPLGLVVVDAAQKIGGVLQVIYSPVRVHHGTRFRTATLTSMYIRPSFMFERDREPNSTHKGEGIWRSSVAMVRHVQAEGVIALSLSAREDSAGQTLSGELGFDTYSKGYLFTPPSLCVPLTMAPVVDAIAVDHRRWLTDHAPYGCRGWSSLGCFLMTKRVFRPAGKVFPWLTRGRHRRIPVTEILHLSDSEAVVDHWPAFVTALCLRDRTLGVLCPESLFDIRQPKGLHIARAFRVHGRTVPIACLDSLYTEIPVMP